MKQHRYRPLTAKQIEDLPISDTTSSSGLGLGSHVVARAGRNETRLKLLELLVAVVIFVLGIALGIAYAHKHGSRASVNGGFPHLHSFTREFSYAADYGAAPSEASNKLWTDLLPPRGGFFDYIVDGQQMHATVSAIHLMHCLDSIRRGYWALHDALSNPSQAPVCEEAFDFDTLPVDVAPEHVSHCIDLLRQDTMCQPDLTIEVSQDALGSVTGYGTIHQCRSWDQLLRVVKDWQLHGYNPKQASHSLPSSSKT